MKAKKQSVQAIMQLSDPQLTQWRVVQSIIWVLGIALLITLLFFQELGIHAFWNVLIPLAPLLLVVATGLWRNICPLATTSLFPRQLNLSKQKRLSIKKQGYISMIGIVLLFLIIPLRHTLLDTSGPATAYVIIVMAAMAVYMGYNYNWKSGWCSSLCPIHPVEKLYGSKVSISLPNAHCESCINCITPCPDSTPEMHPLEQKKTKFHRMAGIIMIGGFSGYIWGWFQVPDYTGLEGWSHIPFTYGMPILGFVITMGLYVLLKQLITEERHIKTLNYLFAAAAVSCYYWFRIPALVGFGIYPGDGMLVDLSDVLPVWFPMASQWVTTLFFIWFMVIRKRVNQWAIRPPFTERVKKQKAMVKAKI